MNKLDAKIGSTSLPDGELRSRVVKPYRPSADTALPSVFVAGTRSTSGSPEGGIKEWLSPRADFQLTRKRRRSPRS